MPLTTFKTRWSWPAVIKSRRFVLSLTTSYWEVTERRKCVWQNLMHIDRQTMVPWQTQKPQSNVSLTKHYIIISNIFSACQIIDNLTCPRDIRRTISRTIFTPICYFYEKVASKNKIRYLDTKFFIKKNYRKMDSCKLSPNLALIGWFLKI
jgi:hypothetical protein